MSTRRQHWESVYQAKSPGEVSWYQPAATASLARLTAHALPPARIIDVGGGASTLVDGLLEAGYRDVTVLDVSPAALEAAQARLGGAAAKVSWIAADLLEQAFPADVYDAWHDRAVFHFLTDAADRRRYAAQLQHAVRPGGIAVIATFAADGPTMCSGLDVCRYAPDTLQAELGAGFTLLESRDHEHVTPRGKIQKFQFSVFRIR